MNLVIYVAALHSLNSLIHLNRGKWVGHSNFSKERTLDGFDAFDRFDAFDGLADEKKQHVTCVYRAFVITIITC